MYPTRLPLSEKLIIALRLAPKGQHVIRDTELPGFFLLIGKRKKRLWRKVTYVPTAGANPFESRSGRSARSKRARHVQRLKQYWDRLERVVSRGQHRGL